MTLQTHIPATLFRLRKHADYQRVYKASRKQFSKQIAYFFAPRPALGPDGEPLRAASPAIPRVGLTVPKALGKAVDRNRIKRRMREAIRASLPELTLPLDLILHPRRSVLDLPFAELRREVAGIFRAVQRTAEKPPRHTPPRPGNTAAAAPASSQTTPGPSVPLREPRSS
ncbi:MAG: ribonuclease P protein component [Acidobacteriota bacterium]|nr:ribonuclease P protein component [Acidobacteriota bacterium]